MAQTDDSIKILKKKEIYEFLEGSGPKLVTHNGIEYGMPYYTGNQLEDICINFGYTDYRPGIRWCYVEGLLDFAIEHNRCNELFCYFFKEERFDNLRELSSMDEIDSVYHSIVRAAIDYINSCVKLTRQELVYVGGHFYIPNA